MSRAGTTDNGEPSVASVSGFEQDLADLIHDHVTECGGDLRFESFRMRWQARWFSFAHNARLVELLEGEYTQMLFSAALPYLSCDGPTVTRITGLYALYLLYHTSQLKPTVRIYVTPRDVCRIADLVNACVALGAHDAVRAAKDLLDTHALVVGVSDRVREEALEDALAGLAPTKKGKKPTPKAKQKRNRKGRATDRESHDDAMESESETRVDEIHEGDASDRDHQDPLVQLTEHVQTASQRALAHLRKTRVPESFAALSEKSGKYAAVVCALRGGSGTASSGKPAGGTSLRGTTTMHELVKKQVVKYDELLRAALRPELMDLPRARREGNGNGLSSAGGAFSRQHVTATAPGRGTRGDGSKKRPPALGKPFRLNETARFGSMPEFPKADAEDAGGGAGNKKSKLG